MTEYSNPKKNASSMSQMSAGEVRLAPSLEVEQLISKLAQDETGKRQHYRPIYSLHKWWARRPGTLFRAILLLATHPELRDTLLANNVLGELDSNSPYFRDYALNDRIVLDPFMGGGTTLVEANRMGMRVIGCDINPVAYWIGRENLKPVDLERLDAYFQQIAATAGQRIREYYRTRCSVCGSDAEIVYAFWVRHIACLRCGKEILLHKRCLLNEGLSRNRPISPANPATAFCAHCLNLMQWNGKLFARCPHCLLEFNPYEGNYNQGYYRCECAAEPISLLETIRSGARLQERLIAFEYWCPVCKDRLYKSPDAEDIQLIQQVECAFVQREASLVLPDTPIPMGTSSRRWIQHGYRSYRDLFNARQLLALNEIIAAIQDIEEEEYRNCFYTVLSNMLEYNNMMTPYNYPHRKLHHLFNYHAMPLTTTPVENNVWGVGEEGAGTFVNCYRRYRNAKLYCQKPFERYRNRSGQVITHYAQHESISAHFVASYEELLQTERGALLLCGDSARLDALPTASVDLVVTDPPYYDNVHYSELSNFFYVWLARLVKHPYFQSELVPTEGEVVVNKGQGKSEEDYLRLLEAVFREAHRVLKPEGRLIFTFHHTNPRAWWTVFQAVQRSGFRLVDFFPVQSEYRVNPHIRNKQALDMDLVLICQKQEQPFVALSHTPSDALERAYQAVGAQSSNGTRNLLYLHFVGELLRSASCTTSDWEPSQEWFLSALQMFESLSTKQTQSRESTPAQLALFESAEGYFPTSLPPQS